MKKFLSLMIVVSMFAGFLIGCTSTEDEASPKQPDSDKSTPIVSEDEGGDDGEKVELSFWSFHSDAELEFMESLATRYMEENENVIINFSQIPQADYMTTSLTTAFASDSGPDIFFMSPGDFLKYANSGIAYDLTPYYTDEMLEDFLPSSIEAVTVDDKIVGVPFEVELLGLYYNIDMLEEANIEPPRTWNDLIDATDKLTQDRVAGMLLDPNRGYYQNFNWYPFLWQAGGNVVNSETKEATFEGEAVEKSLQLWRDLIEAGAPTQISVPGTFEASPLGTGETAMQIIGTWAVADIENVYPDMNIGLTPLPIPEGGEAVTCAGGWKLMVNADSVNPDEAAKFAMWAFAEDIDKPLEWCTKVKFAYSPRQSVVEAGGDIYSKGLRKVFTEEIYETAVGEPRYPTEIVNAVGDALQSVMLKGSDPAEEAKKANEIIKKFLEDYEGSL